jgi:putrescine transport system ATP-binding protein
MLDLVQLGAMARRKPHQLSGGQQQRVALARSLAKRPQLLLLDEPLGALDRKLREQTQFELVNIIQRVGVTCVMVTHDQEEAMTMADRLAVMSKGRVLQVGRPDEVYKHPTNRFVADFIGSVNLFDGHVEACGSGQCTVTTPGGALTVAHEEPLAPRLPVSVAVRPEKIEIARQAPTGEAIGAVANLWRGTVREIAYLGAFNTFIVETAQGLRVRVTGVNSARQDLSGITWNDEVVFWWPPEAGVLLRD